MKKKIIIPAEKQLSNGIPKGKLDYMIGVEEAKVNSYAEAYARQMWGEYYDNEYDTGTDLTYGEACKNDFLAGVKWQKEQNKNLYSKEYLEKAYYQGWATRERFDDLSPEIIYPEGLDYEEKQEYAFNLWFEQLKRNKI